MAKECRDMRELRDKVSATLWAPNGPIFLAGLPPAEEKPLLTSIR